MTTDFLSSKQNANNGRVSVFSVLVAVYLALLPIESALAIGWFGSVHKLLGIVLVLAYLVDHNGHIQLSFSYLEKWHLGFAFITLISTMWSLSPSVTMNYAFTITSMVLISWLMTQHTYTLSEYNLLVRIYMISGILISLIIIFGSSFVNVSFGRYSIVIGGAVIDQNNLALGLSIPAMLAMSILFDKTERLGWKIISVICLTVALYAIFLTGSRGGLLCLVIAAIVYILIRLKNAPIFSKVLIVAAAVSLVFTFQYFLAILPGDLSVRFTLADVQKDGGALRINIWEAAFKGFADNDIIRKTFGIGYGAFPNFITRYFFKDVAAHNDYVQILLELGIVGLTYFLLMLKNEIKLCIKRSNGLGIALILIVMVSCVSMETVFKKAFWAVLVMSSLTTQIKGNDVIERTMKAGQRHIK